MKKARKIFGRKGLKALSAWARKKPLSRWKKAAKFARNRATFFRKRLKEVRQERRQLVQEKVALQRLLVDKRTANRTIRKELRTGDPSPRRRKNLEEKLAENVADVEKLKARLKDVRKRLRFLLDSEDHKADKVAWWVKRNTVFRRRYRKAKKEHKKEGGQPKFEPWMANGYNWQDSNQAVRDFVARAVVIDGNYTTSMARNYVPPGGSQTSFHLSGKAADVGPSLKTQYREYELNKGNPKCLELFGPDNYKNLKYGNTITLAAGSGIELLHNTHNHGAFDD